MRRTVLALLLAVTPVAAQDCPATGAAETIALARQWQDPAALPEILADDVIHHAAGGDLDTAGAPDTLAARQALTAAFPDLSVTIDAVIAEGDTVATRFTATGTQTGPFGDLAPSDRSATWTGIDIVRIACGRIAEVWSEVDAQSRLRQLLGDMP